MVEPLSARSSWDGSLALGRHGRADGQAGVVIVEESGRRIASIASRRGHAAAVIQAAHQAWGVTLPTTPRSEAGQQISFVWSGPGQWLALSAAGQDGLEQILARHLTDHASVVEQGDGRVVLHLSGPRVRDMLAKLVAVDLHPRAFKAGDVALTQAAHIGVQFWQLDHTPSFRLIAFRGFAASLLHAMLSAGAEYGVDLLSRG